MKVQTANPWPVSCLDIAIKPHPLSASVLIAFIGSLLFSYVRTFFFVLNYIATYVCVISVMMVCVQRLVYILYNGAWLDLVLVDILPGTHVYCSTTGWL